MTGLLSVVRAGQIGPLRFCFKKTDDEIKMLIDEIPSVVYLFLVLLTEGRLSGRQPKAERDAAPAARGLSPSRPGAPGAGRRVKGTRSREIAEPSEASLPTDWGADPENQKSPR
jgi:hypothetical protein